MRKLVSSLLIALVATLLLLVPAGDVARPPVALAASGATFPAAPNYNFEAGPTQVGNGPTNYDFSSGGSSWSKVGAGSVTYPSGIATFSGSVQITTTNTYTLSNEIQSIRLRFKAGGAATVTILQGGSSVGSGNLNCFGCTSGNWYEKHIAVATSAQGQAVKIRIAQSSGSSEVDWIGTQFVSFPQWTGTSGGVSSQPKTDHTNYAEIAGTSLYSSSFNLTANQVEFDYSFPSGSSTSFTAYLRRASNSAQLSSKSLSGSNVDWTHVVWSWGTDYIGTEVYVQLYSPGQPTRVDNIGIDLLSAVSKQSDPSLKAGDPFDTSTGQFTHAHTDIAIPGKGMPLEFTRSYHSMLTADGSLGFNWSHTYSISLRIDSDNSVMVYFPAGGSAYFKYNGGSYTPPGDVHDSLVKNGDGSYTLTTMRAVEYNFTSAGKLSTIVDRNGNTTTISYDGSGYLSEVEDAGGRTLTFTPDGSGRIVEIEDPLGRTIEFEYDADGDLIEVTDLKGGVTEYTYTNHQMTSLTDSNSHLQNETIYDRANRVVEQTDATGGITCVYYGTSPSYSSGNCTGVAPSPSAGQTVVVNPRGYKATYDFDTKFRTTSVTDHNGDSTAFSYDNEDNLTCVTDPLGNKTGFVYDGDGNLTEVSDANNTDSSCDLDGVGWAFTYTALNDIATATDPLGRETEYIYDPSGNLTRIVRMDDSTNILLLTCFEYGNSDGQVTAVVESTDLQVPGDEEDPCTGHKTEFEYNAYGNLAAITDPRFSGGGSPPQTVLDPDDAGRVLSIMDELSHATSATYDNFDMPLTVTDELGNTSSWSYDAKGNLLTMTDANRQQVGATSEADVAGCGAAGTGDGVDDDTGDSDGVADDGCPNSIYVYDDADRLIEVIDALGNSTTYAYDENSNLVSVTDANRQAVSAPESGADCGAAGTGDGSDDDSDTVADDGCPAKIYAYDELDRLVSVTDALGRETTYDYDEASNLIERVDARGLITDYIPDALNRLDTIEYWNSAHTVMDSSVDYDFDEVGNRIEMVDSTGTTTYTPDPLNRLESVTFPGSITVSHQYDEVGDRTKITYPSTDEVDYTYDEAHNLETVTDWLSQATGYFYDDAGRLDNMGLPNGVDTDYGYDDANRLTDLTNVGPGPTTISDYAYLLDAVGNRAEMTDLAGTHDYVYDALYRLTEVTYPDPETDAYTYDGNGNRLTKDSDDYVYDDANQLLDVEGATYTYDENGNTTTFTSLARQPVSTPESGADCGADGTGDGVDDDSDTYTDDGCPNAIYTYDHENRLTEAVIDGVVSTSTYNGDGLRMSLTVDDGSPVTTDYVWDVNAGLPVVLDDGANQYVYGLDLISATDSLDDQIYYLYDGLGSTTALSDDMGAATDTYAYDVFGAVRASTGATPNPWLFTGEQFDADSELYHLRARQYDPATGRFLTVDPQGSGEQYAYTGSNPATFTDPYGLWGPKDLAKAATSTGNWFVDQTQANLDATAHYAINVYNRPSTFPQETLGI